MGTRGDVLTAGQFRDRTVNVAGRSGSALALARIERPLVSSLHLDWNRERCKPLRKLSRAIQGSSSCSTSSSNARFIYEIRCSFFSGDELHWDLLRAESEGLHTGSWRSGGRRNLTVLAADFYKTLGISKSASKQEIKSAYRRLARQYHPDVNKQPGAEDKFKEISNAYEILSDDEKRPLYDQFGEAGVRDGSRGPGAGAYATNPFDLFESFFGGSMGGMGGSGFGTRRRSTVVQGDDIRYDMVLEFNEAIFGTEKDFEAVHLETCPICDGSGAKSGTSRKSCTTCGGMGQVMRTQETPFGTFSQVSTCSTCAGEGEVISEYCRKCGGEGRIRVKKNIKVKIPAGVNSGSTLRVRGEGDTGPRGGPAGDLYVFLNVKETPGIQRDGMSLYSNISISFTDAILGTVVKVKTVDGNTDLQIPSGTQPGDVLVLSKMGAPKLNKPANRGDHFFTVKVTIPIRLNDAERRLVEELAYLQKNKSGSRGSSLNSRPQPQRRKTVQEGSKSSAYEKDQAVNSTAIKKPEKEEEGGLWDTLKNAAGSAATGALNWLRDKL